MSKTKAAPKKPGFFQAHKAFLAILLLSAAARWYFFNDIEIYSPVRPWTPSYYFFFGALKDHFLDYVYHFAFKPPFFLFVWKAVLIVFRDIEFINNHYIFLWVAFLFDFAALWLSRALLRRLKIRPSLIFLSLLGISVYLIPFEFWRQGFHYDHYSFFLTVLFMHAVVRYLESFSLKNSVYLGVSTFLLAMFSPVLPPVAVAGLAVGILCFPQEGPAVYHTPAFWQKAVKMAGVAAVGIALGLSVLMIKHKFLGIGAVPSNAAGGELMLVVQQALTPGDPRVRRAVWKAGVPDWYKWCWDHANAEVFGGAWFAESRGVCAPRATELGLTKGESWPFDFTALHTYLKENGPADVLEVVERDIVTMTQKPYLFTGINNEAAPRFIGVYGAESLKVVKSVLWAYPGLMWKGFWERFKIFSDFGAYSPLKLSGFMNKKTKGGQALYWFSWFVKGLYFLSLGAMLFALFYVCGRVIRKKEYVKNPEWWRYFALFSASFLGFIFLYSGFSYTENERYFVLGVPFLMVLNALIFEKALSFLEGLGRR